MGLVSCEEKLRGKQKHHSPHCSPEREKLKAPRTAGQGGREPGRTGSCLGAQKPGREVKGRKEQKALLEPGKACQSGRNGGMPSTLLFSNQWNLTGWQVKERVEAGHTE